LSDSLAAALRVGERAADGWSLAVPRSAARGLAGPRLGRRPGSSLDFQEYRDYRPGDDLRHLDWAAYGRSDRLLVKLYHEEVTPHLDLLLDGSRSMAAGGDAKAPATVALAAFLATAAARGGFSHAAWLAADGCHRLGASPALWQPTFEHRGGLADAFARRPPRLMARGVRILISDLLDPEEPRAVLTRLGRGAASVVVIHLLAAEELSPKPVGFARLEDVETGERRDLLLDAAAVDRYRHALAEHREGWRRGCREVGAVLATVEAEAVWSAWSRGDRRPGLLEELVREEVLAAA